MAPLSTPFGVSPVIRFNPFVVGMATSHNAWFGLDVEFLTAHMAVRRPNACLKSVWHTTWVDKSQ